MIGLMGELPLSLDLFVRRVVSLFGEKEIVSAGPRGRSRVSYERWAERVERLGPALDALGVTKDARVGSLCWSTVEHLELYFGVPGSGRVLHTINPRFGPDQLVHTIAEAGDEVIISHRSLVPVLARVLDRTPSVRHLVVIEDVRGGSVPDDATLPLEVHEYEELLSGVSGAPLECADERRAAVLCYTGGTTGPAKGVLYSHRSLVLHALAVTQAGGIAIEERDVVMPVVPLFHANAVGFPHAAVATGATLVLPGSDLSGPALADLIVGEKVSVTCGVPTVWITVLPHLAGRDVPSLRMIVSGASAVPRTLSERYRREVGVPLTQIWGMTETSPLASMVSFRSDFADLGPDDWADVRSTVGIPVLGVEARIAHDPTIPDGDRGELQVRGPWVATGYFAGRSPESFTQDGWLRTGDIVSRDRWGNLRIVDRLKDLIKSGGEWISSIELEHHLMEHPDVAEAAVIGMADEHWGERPVAIVVPGARRPSARELEDHLRSRVPSWWVPDRYEFVDEIPRTAVGKYAKTELRDRFRGAHG